MSKIDGVMICSECLIKHSIVTSIQHTTSKCMACGTTSRLWTLEDADHHLRRQKALYKRINRGAKGNESDEI